VTGRDRLVLLVVALGALVAGAWFGLISPQRKDAADLAAKIEAKRGELVAAQQAAATASQAKARYTADYATVARLGKAVPADDDVPSLVFQLDTVADRFGVDVRKLKVEASGSSGTTAAAPPAAQAAAVATAGGGGGASGPSGPAGATGAAGPAAVGATQGAAAGLPPGVGVGAAGLPTLPFSFTFDGSFFGMQKFFRELDRLNRVGADGLVVRGRLMSIDGFSLSASREGFPKVAAQVAATTYVLPADQGLLAGATPTAPAGAAPAGTAPAATPASSAVTSSPAPAEGVR
jgi:hypothetical protein